MDLKPLQGYQEKFSGLNTRKISKGFLIGGLVALLGRFSCSYQGYGIQLHKKMLNLQLHPKSSFSWKFTCSWTFSDRLLSSLLAQFVYKGSGIQLQISDAC